MCLSMAAIESVEYIDNIIKNPFHSTLLLSFTSLISFIGGRHVVSDFYDHRSDILCNPLVKIIILFSILYMNVKNIKLTIILFFIYIFFIDNYVENGCTKEYLETVPPVKATATTIT